VGATPWRFKSSHPHPRPEQVITAQAFSLSPYSVRKRCLRATGFRVDGVRLITRRPPGRLLCAPRLVSGRAGRRLSETVVDSSAERIPARREGDACGQRGHSNRNSQRRGVKVSTCAASSFSSRTMSRSSSRRGGCSRSRKRDSMRQPTCFFLSFRNARDGRPSARFGCDSTSAAAATDVFARRDGGVGRCCLSKKPAGRAGLLAER
jgi:hypothetical protein